MSEVLDAPVTPEPMAIDLRQRFGAESGPRRDDQALQHAGRILEHLRTQLAELDRREQNLNSQLSSMDQERRSLRLWSQQFNEEAERREQELRAREIKLAEREAGFEAYTAEVESREKSLATEWESLAAARAAMKSELASEIEQERRDLTEATRRLELDSRELQRRQSEFESAQSLQYENNLREMESLRAEKLAEIDRREAEVTRREIDVEKRARFHEDHLDRVRRDLADQRRDLERERQRQRVWMEQVEESIRLRLAHVRRYRDLVTQREQSIEQERELLQQAKANSDAEIAESRKLLQAQWQAFEQGRDANLAELERRAADLAQRQEACDIKAQKVEELRQAAERANQEILEQRVIVEQVRAEIDRSVGTEEADALIQQVQSQLHEQWKHVRESLVQQRDELEDTRQSIVRLRDEFRDEREVLTNWVSQREYQLKAAEEALTRERANSQLAENRWTAARDRWRQEKIEAENIIRGLLLQLEIMASVPPDISYPSAPGQTASVDEVSGLQTDEYGQLVDAA
jgi:hypothetical protein